MIKLEIKKRLLLAIRTTKICERLLNRSIKLKKQSKIKGKSPRDIVLKEDIILEDKIYKLVSRSFKNDSFLGEELGIKKKMGDFEWVVDPLDGTVNYIHGIPVYAISIAIFYKKRCVAGVIYNVKEKELYYASKNNGAYMNGKRIFVSNEKKLENSLIIALLPSKVNHKSKIYTLISKLNDISRGVLRIGSSAIAYTYLASGKVQAIWGCNNKIWDVSAGIIISSEAMGKTTKNNKKFKNVKTLLSTNKFIHKSLIKYI
tara:strand:+ start:32 stop:808 length:777 start_codon:yes stop_codon:yes gene_type:complete